MFFVIISFVLYLVSPGPNVLLATFCQEQGLDSSTCAVFQTLHAAWQAEQEYKNSHDGDYLTLSIFENQCLSPSSFEKKLGCQLPYSSITDSTYYITVAQRTVDGDTRAESLLLIGFFKRDHEHLPIGNFCYNITQNSLHFEYITLDTSYCLDYSLPAENEQ
jgi:hypothetical protein